MTHLDEGTLRRMGDEPLAISAAQQRHYDGCDRCRERGARIGAGTRAIAELLAVPALSVDPRVAYARLMTRVNAQEAAHPVHWYERRAPAIGWLGLLRAAAVVVVAAALAVGFTASGYAQRLLTVFHPTRIVSVQVSPADLRGAGPILEYGSLAWNPAPPAVQAAGSLAVAARTAGLPALTPGTLPAAVGTSVTYGTIGQATASYRFDRNRLAASAARQGVRAAPMPEAIDGSTLYVTTGPSLLQVYGPLPVGAGAPAAQPSAQAGGLYGSLPRLVIVETRTPTVTSTGASASQLQDYLLAQPGVPPDLAAQLRAIKDPTSALPIPIPNGLATSKPVQVQGVQGLLVDAGLAVGVIWQKDGIIYAVLGQLTPDQILQIAGSLH